MTVLYPIPCYNEVCYKGTVLYHQNARPDLGQNCLQRLQQRILVIKEFVFIFYVPVNNISVMLRRVFQG